MSLGTNNALALHEILLTIADSLNQAQHQLRNMPPYDEYGRPNPIYQLPYLDFNLEVTSEIVAESTTNTQITAGANTAYAQKSMLTAIPMASQRLAFSPRNTTTESSNSSSNKITSTISGRFVAVMPNEGLPQVIIGLEAIKVTATKYNLEARLSYATSEPVIGQKVEINFDEQSSLSINNNLPVAKVPVFSPTKEGFTDANGVYKTSITIDPADANKTIIFVANSGTIFTSVALSNS